MHWADLESLEYLDSLLDFFVNDDSMGPFLACRVPRPSYNSSRTDILDGNKHRIFRFLHDTSPRIPLPLL